MGSWWDVIFLIDDDEKIEWPVRVPILSGNRSGTIILVVFLIQRDWTVLVWISRWDIRVLLPRSAGGFRLTTSVSEPCAQRFASRMDRLLIKPLESTLRQ